MDPQYTQLCRKCNYVWESRKTNPKSCPRCKTRKDTIYSTYLDNSDSGISKVTKEDNDWGKHWITARNELRKEQRKKWSNF